MSKFNQTATGKTETTFEGAPAYKKDLATDWLNFIFSSYLEGGFYTSQQENISRFIGLTKSMIDVYGPEFVAKAAVMSRNAFGLRSVSQMVAAILNEYKWDTKRNFYRTYCRRPDDVTEIFSIMDNVLKTKRSHGLIRGFGDYLSNLKPYQIDKYKLINKEYSLYDVINLTHAKSAAIADFKNGTLKKADTWEQKMSAGEATWEEIVDSKTLGYLALIRNLRNILKEPHPEGWIDNVLCPQLINKDSIKKSLVYPYQIYCAAKNIEVTNYSVLSALDKAFRIACGNMEKLGGKSLIILDVSSSMCSPISTKSNISLVEVGACYAAALYISQDCKIIKFGTYARMVESLNTNTNVFEIIKGLTDNEYLGYSTEISRAFDLIHEHYDRMFIISDFQVMKFGYGSPQRILNDICKKYGQSMCYSFDLANYATCLESPKNSNVKYCTALNDTVFKLIPFLEDGKSLVDFINEF